MILDTKPAGMRESLDDEQFRMLAEVDATLEIPEIEEQLREFDVQEERKRL